ncbi:hypothetical protein FACS1894151_11280 [Spirochaetia bacterium]|nr:hypothetical protein FACS1894151_11280 [Spirochaetia bacterium]
MPYIGINTAQDLSGAQKEKIKAEFGRLIAIIPTKSEAGLLVDFSGGHTLYRAGADVQGAFVEVRLFKPAPLEAKKQFTKEVFDLMERELGVKKEHMYFNIMEFENWGLNGELK